MKFTFSVARMVCAAPNIIEIFNSGYRRTDKVCCDIEISDFWIIRGRLGRCRLTILIMRHKADQCFFFALGYPICRISAGGQT